MNPGAVKAMKSGNTSEWVRNYYGEANTDYIKHVNKSIARYNKQYRASS